MTQRGHRFAWLALAIASCTVNNPLYTPGVVGGDLGRGSDAALPPGSDLSMSVPVGADLSSAACMPADRACVAMGTEACVSGVLVQDRVCPTASVCTAGHCVAPPAGGSGTIGKSCALAAGKPATEALCVNGGGNQSTQPSCQPFVDPVTLEVSWVCASHIGTGLPGTTCTTGATCRSGFCGSNGTCFRACVSVADCPTSGPFGSWTCDSVLITVEGVAVNATSCIPH